ncbi:MAG: aspartyl protease family protein [Chitinophagaceae bacterium]|nr:aspartyl protease family protein [Chitinophagaceae bacterium]MCW5927235.1 aspartyl protease family protein [Chitinophagaceae bacterium]
MKRNLSIFILVICKCLNCIGQTEAVQEPPAKMITSFSFHQHSGGVITIQALVNNYTDTLNFILDTGSGGISLDSATVSELSIPTEPSERTIRGIAGIRKVNFLYNARLHLPGLTIDSLNFHVNDYEILSSVYGIKIDGIIGYSFFSQYIVNLDFDNSTLTVYTPGKFRYKRRGQILKPLLTAIPIVNSQFSEWGKFDARFYFDTGAGLCYLISSSYANDSLVFKANKKSFLTQAEGLGGKTSMRVTTLKRVKLGRYTFKNVPTYVYDDIYNITAYPYLAGLIGNDLLRRFNMTINYPKKEIHIVPNTHYHSKFDYAYTGMSIYTVDGKIIAEDIIENSPAETAGLKEGDILLAVENNFSGNIQTYKNLLQVPKRKLKLLVKRDEALLVLTLRPASIL